MAVETPAPRVRSVTLALLAVAVVAAAALGSEPLHCQPIPVEPPGESSCDDGTMVMCASPTPICHDPEILAVQNGCETCVLPQTCRPWGIAGCASDRDCALDERCDPCGVSSCPACFDCVAACMLHGCPTEDEVWCNCVRPDCEGGAVAVVRDGCWVCVGLGACAPMGETNACGAP